MKNYALIAIIAISALAAGILLQKYEYTAVGPVTLATLDFSFPDAHGQPQSVAQWRGKILVINFWATWCPPCLEEIPQFVKWQQEFLGKDVQFVGIAIDDQQAVLDYLREAAINYPILIAGDEGAMLAQQLGNIINAVPFTVIVDRQGQIVHRQPGELSREQFLEVVQPLVD